MLKIHRVVFVCLVLLKLAVSASALDIPLDEIDAAARLADGTLDSVLWLKIAPFYEVPVVVEKENLAVLADIIPEYADDLPGHNTLLTYMPWSASSVRRFLSDYPYLADLSPILTFDTTHISTLGAVRITLPRQVLISASRTTVNFSLEPADGFGAEGRVYSDTSGLLWGRRRLFTRLPGNGSLSIGNIRPEYNSGLFLGSFSTATINDTSPIHQFIQGSVATWNGVLWMQKWGNAMSSEALFHSRPAEKAISLQIVPVLAPGVQADVGVSYLSSGAGTIAADTTYAVTAGIACIHREWSVRANSCIPSSGAGVVPFTCAIGHRRINQNFLLYGVFIPEGFPGNRSQVVQTVSNMTGNDLPMEEIIWIGADYTRKTFPSVASTASLSFIRHGLRSHGRASLVLSGNQPFDFRLNYTCTVSEKMYAVYYIRHEVTSTGSARIVAQSMIKTSGTVSYMQGTIKYRGRISLLTSLNQALTVEPFIQASTAISTGSGLSIGIRQELVFARKVKGIFTLDTPCFPWSANQTAIALISSFLL